MTPRPAELRNGALPAAAAQRRLLLLSATRWFPVGLVFGLTTLLPLQRGLDLTQVAVVLAVQGFVVLGLEVPSGGLADAVGRRPVLVAGALVATASGVVFLAADGVAGFAVAFVLQGVFRALDSGPLEAWYVDTASAADPGVRVEQGLSRAGVVLGVAIAAGALASGGLVAWHPVAATGALTLPYLLATTLYGVHALLVAVLVREPRRRRPADGQPLVHSMAGAAGVVADGLRTLRRSRVLRTLVLVEVFWSVGLIGIETFSPVRLAELVGGTERAGALYGPASAAAWALFAAGAGLAAVGSRWVGVGWTALGVRVLNGGTIVAMGLAAGPVGLVTAYWAAYLTHGAAGPVHNTLLHREANPGNRATVLSLNSMVAGGYYSVGLLVLGPLAEHTSTGLAVVVTGAFSVLGAALYLPAIRSERAARTAAGRREPMDVPEAVRPRRG